MTMWQEELDLILLRDLKSAAETYHLHRPDVSLKDAKAIVCDVAESLGIVVLPKERSKLFDERK